MKCRTLTILLLLLHITVASAIAYQRTVLVEDFTNWGCVPCAIPNTYLHNAIESFTSDEAFDIAYHMSWPSGSDPFYLANQSENDTRRYYYGVNAVPHMRCNGTIQMSTSSQSSMISVINSQLSIPSDIWLDLSAQVVGDEIHVTCTAYADVAITGNKVLHMLVLDRYTYLPGTPNGNPNHYHAMLDMAPTAYGQMFNVSAFDSTYYMEIFPLNSSWLIENLDIACFVQDNDTHSILQARVEEMPLDFPNIFIAEYEVTDLTGNNDGRVDPGETGEMMVTLENMAPFHDATDVQAELSTDDPLITITSNTAAYPDLISGASAANTSNPFVFDVDPAFEAHEVTFNIAVTAEPGSFTSTYQITFMVGRPDILLLNDDLLGFYQEWYEESLDEVNEVYDSWIQPLQGFLPLDEMNRYNIVIWYTGDDSYSPLSGDEQTKIENFLNEGGRLLLSSQYAGDVIGGSTFHENVLHSWHQVNSTGELLLSGVSGDPVSDSTSITFAGSGGAGNNNSCSGMDPISPAVGIYTYNVSGLFGALRCQTDVTRFIYFGFPLEAATGAVGTTPRAEIIDNCLNWLRGDVAVEPDDPATYLPEQLELDGVYPNPFNPSTEIRIALPTNQLSKLQVFNLQGKLVSDLLSGDLNADRYSVLWDASNLASGVYIVTLSHGTARLSTKAILIK